MCSGLRVETAIEGSFCLCKNGSPLGHFVPDTMFTFWPATCAPAGGAARKTAAHTNPKKAHKTRTDNLIVKLLEAVVSRSIVAPYQDRRAVAGFPKKTDIAGQNLEGRGEGLTTY